MVCVLSLLCLVIGLLVGYLYGKGKAGKDYKAHTQELLDARQKAYDDMLAALRIINLTWTQIAQAQNHELVYELANEMMDRVGQFMDRYKAIGKALESAGKAYEAAGKKLEPSGQSIIQTCAKLQKLGAKQSSKNPISQLQDADLEGSKELPEPEPEND